MKVQDNAPDEAPGGDGSVAPSANPGKQQASGGTEQRAGLHAVSPVAYTIPVPPPLSALFNNAKGPGRVKSRRYRAWIKAAMAELMAQRARPFPGMCDLIVKIPMSARGDASNRLKAPEDLIVRAGIIPDDNKKYVRRVSAQWVEKDQPCTIVLEAV